MDFLKPSIRTMRAYPLVSKRIFLRNLFARQRGFPRPCRQFTTAPARGRSFEEHIRGNESDISLHRLEHERRAYYKRRFNVALIGTISGMIAVALTAWAIAIQEPHKPSKLDAPGDKRKDDPLITLGRERKVVVQKLGEEPEENVDVVETGTSSVPTFPRLLEFADDGKHGATGELVENSLVEYQLMGLGIRTVSFLGIQVYVVGMYIATDDIATLQEALVRRIDPVATTLVAGEKDKLKSLLLDPEQGEAIWNDIIKDTKIRSLIRIVPTRDTDFGHLRDAFVRHLTNRSKRHPEEYGDEAFGASVNQLKALFRKGNLPKRRELLMARLQDGALVAWYDDGKNGPRRLGEVTDERISRSLWLNYLAGKMVASEGARISIVNGVMEFVERPVGTVATQVHV